MSTLEKETRYREAVRYMNNATEILRTKANKNRKYYEDAKYVRMACGTAYSGVLLALETYLEAKGKPIERKRSWRTSIEDYRRRLGSLDQKILRTFNTAYEILHLVGYYEGETSYGVIRSGMDAAVDVINKIKPAGLEGLRLN